MLAVSALLAQLSKHSWPALNMHHTKWMAVWSACSFAGDTGEDESIIQGRKEVEKRLRSVDSLLTEAAKYLPGSRVQVSIWNVYVALVLVFF